MLDLEILRIIWWVLIGVLFMAFAVTDGYDLGAAVLFPFIARSEGEKRIVLNTIGAIWEGNQVWIILGAGALFAAWPPVYAVAFSGAYFPVLLLLLTMGISRPVSFKYRSKLVNPVWREWWDRIVFIGGLFPSIIFGVLVGNILLGLPFYLDDTLRIYNTGSFWQLFSPFALWCGLVSLCMFVMHGGLWMAAKTNGDLRYRAMRGGCIGAILLIITFAIGGFWVSQMPGYELVSVVDGMQPSNPLHKQVMTATGAWFLNYQTHPVLLLAPALGFAGAFLALLLARRNVDFLAFIASSLSVIGVVGTVGVSMFPFIVPSSVNSTSSLLVWDASSSYLTLLVMFMSVLIFLPIILVYQTWVHSQFRGKLSEPMLEKEKQAY